MVLGGSAFSLLPAEFLSRLEVDSGVIGEGEETFTRLLDALDAGLKPDTVPGVAVRARTLGSFVPATPIRQPGKGLARGWELIDVDTYWQWSAQLPLQSKRGCVYCTCPNLEGDDTRSREVGAVVDEIERWVRDRRINHFFFVDNIFNSPIEHATLILEEILRRPLRIGWTAYVTPRVSTRAFSELMVRSGCRGVAVGVDGGSDTTMRSLNKGFRPEHVRQYFAHAHAAGLHTCCTLILGAPGESRATLDETFELIDTIRPDAVVAMVGVRIYPGTGLWPIAVESGQVDPAADPLEPAFYISDQLTDDDLKSLLDRAAARANWVIPGENLGLDKDLFARLRKKHIKGPLWRLMRCANTIAVSQTRKI